MLEVVVVSLLISSLRFWLPYLFGTCIDDHDFHESQGDKNELANVPNPIPFHCEGEQTNDLGVMLWLPSEYMLKWLLHTSGYNTSSLFFFFLFFWCCFHLWASYSIGTIYSCLCYWWMLWTVGGTACRVNNWKLQSHHLLYIFRFCFCSRWNHKSNYFGCDDCFGKYTKL